MTSKLLVAVVTYRSSAVLPGLLATLPAGMSGVDSWRLVIADNASTDDTVAVARELAPHAEIVQTGGNLGYGAGVNACLELAKPDEDLLVLNADIRLQDGCIRRLQAECADEAVGAAVPWVTHDDGSPEITLRRKPTALRAWGESLLGGRADRFHSLSERIWPGSTREADWANGAFLYIPARVWRRIGAWRADLFLYSEEVDYCRRITDAGWLIRQVTTARAVHKGGEATTAPLLWAQLTTNKVVHAARWDGLAAARATWLALAVGQLLRLPLRRGTHSAALRALWTGRSRLLRGEPTNPAAPSEFGSRIAVSAHGGGRR
ncbi:glycosyltransferase family 2 protein [Pseudonocardiaceae bacterium YIM PH 21723]|nr:glycosyltransferase family 2 protein [Pseudonocardiaceae bacterium YIM PH 21723]